LVDLDQVEQQILIVGDDRDQALERAAQRGGVLLGVVLDEEIAGLGIGRERLGPLVLVGLLGADHVRAGQSRDQVLAGVAAGQPVDRLGTDEREHVLPVPERLGVAFFRLVYAGAAL